MFKIILSIIVLVSKYGPSGGCLSLILANTLTRMPKQWAQHFLEESRLVQYKEK